MDVPASPSCSAATPSWSVCADAADADDGVALHGRSSAQLSSMTAACRALLEGVGEDPSRDGLVKTPARMARALLALTAGYAMDPKEVVGDALFECDSEEMVVVRDIDVYSMCEHHMLPFFGKVHVAYIPSGKVVGLSKLARLTDVFAKRLQIQERLTKQIAQAVQDICGARGVAVMVEATHMCMTMRGVEKPGSITATSAYTGVFAEREAVAGGGAAATPPLSAAARSARAEFFAAVARSSSSGGVSGCSGGKGGGCGC